MTSVLLSVISSLFWAAGKLFEWLYAKQLVDAGKTQSQLEALRNQVHEAEIAVAAREAVRAAILKSPGSIVPEHDPFLRD
jgi:hypothetical protein